MEKIIKELESLKLSNTGFRAGSYNEGINAVLHLIKSSLPKPVEVPEFPQHIVEYLEWCKLRDVKLKDVIGAASAYHSDYVYWTEEEIRKIAVAYSTGNYTVVKELKTHVLKLDSEYYDDVVSGFKKFEIRFNDRDYKVGDILVLEEYDGIDYTGDRCKRKVTYITDYAQQDGYVVLGIEPVEEIQKLPQEIEVSEYLEEEAE